MPKRRFAGLLAAVLTVTPLAACGGGGDDGPEVVVYNAQHEELIDVVAKAFEDRTGIDVRLRNGSDLELANQLVTEGDASPADVFLTENSPAMSLVDKAGLFARLDQATLDNIPEQFRPDSGRWTGFLARSTVLVYNTSMVQTDELPDSLLELAEPQWKDKVSFSPTGADFQAIVSAVLDLEGEEATRAWLEGLKANGTVYDGNNVVLESVNAGETAAGVIYHYYWYRDQEEAGDNSSNTKLHFFDDQDPGAYLSTSGAGVLTNGKNSVNAQKFVQFLTSVEGQQIIADSYALEYTLNEEVQLERGVKPLDELEPPDVDVDSLNSEKVVELMRDTGFL